MSVLQVIEWLVIAAAAVIALASGIWIRSQQRQGEGITFGTIFTAFWLTASVVVVLWWDFSGFHLIWLYPVGIVLGLLGLVFPFSLLVRPIANIYGTLWSLGLDRKEIDRNRALREYIRERGVARNAFTDSVAKAALMDEIRRHRDFIMQRMLEMRASGLNGEEAAAAVASEIESGHAEGRH